jgi:type III secretory pathway component EscV
LTLALVAFVIQDSVSVYLSGQSQVLPGAAFLLGNPLLAVVYLSVPYLFMVTIDIRARRKAKKDEHMDKITTTYLERSGATEQESDEEKASATDKYT